MGKSKQARKKRGKRTNSSRRPSIADSSTAALLDACQRGDRPALARELARWTEEPTAAARAFAASRESWDRRALGLSVLMATRPDAAFFEGLTALLPEVAEGNLTSFQALLYYLMRAIFTQPKEAHGANTAAFYCDRLWPPYLRLLRSAASSAPIAPLLNRTVTPHRRRLAVVAPQILTPRHGPTQQALELAYSAQRAGWSVLLVNADLMPTRPHPSLYRSFVANRIAEFDSEQSYTYSGQSIPFFQTQRADFCEAHLARTIERVIDFAPEVVVSQNVFNFAADLLSEVFPTIFIPASYSMAASRADVYTGGPDEWMDPVDGQRGVFRQQHYFALHTPEPSQALTRLPPPAFLYAVVGTRLASDLKNTEFLDCLEAILTKAPHTHVLQVGDEANHLANALPQFAARFHAMPAVENLRSVYRGCNGYLNPFRSGGGISAHIATLERVPIVSLRTYQDDYVLDVSTYLHGDAWSADPESFVKDAIALTEDGSFYSRRLALLDEHRRQWPLLRENFSEFEEFISLAVERFETRRGLSHRASSGARETPARDQRSHHQLEPR